MKKPAQAAMTICGHRIVASLLLLGTTLAYSQSDKTEATHKYNKPDQYAELAKAPEKARSRTNPLESDTDSVPAGKKLFEDHCAECHGNDATGARKGPNLRAPEVQQASAGTLFWVLTNGVVRKGMPVWSKLPEPQRWQIVTYLKSLGPVQPHE